MHRCLGCMEEFDSQYSICPYCGYEIGTPPKEAYHMIPGTMLAGRYLVGQVLGFGGFGVTYIGYDVLLNRKVAFKEYLPSEFATRIPGSTEITTYEGERFEQFSNGLNKFMDEAKMLAKFQASNGIVQIYDSFQENGTAYIVMEYLEGRTLKEYLEQVEKVSVEEAKEILHPILVALQDVHELGILHRDIAPDNIFLTSDGKVKLLDFGASRFATTSHSKSLSVIIKPGYAPVEQYRSRGDQGTWTDVYSLAATFYKMITGITPEDSMERIEKEELKKPSKLGVKIPKNVENAIMNALNIKIEDRTQNVVQLEKQMYTDEKVKLRFVKLKKADVGKMPIWAKIAIPFFATCIAVFITLLATGVIKFYRIIPENFVLAEGKTRIPNLVNEDLENATLMTDNNELILQVVDKQFSEYIPENLVLVQYQDKGKIVNVGEMVEIVISGGREIVFMPDVSAYSLEQALEMLERFGITATIVEEYGDGAVGTVIKQSVAANDQLRRGDTITLTVSKGYDTLVDNSVEVTVPDLTGMTFEKASNLLKKYGLYLKKAGEEESKTVKAGCITRQMTPAESKVHQGDTIEVYVAKSEQKLYMPDVQYKDEATAKATLENMGLKVEITYQESETVAKGKVMSQSIAAYAEVKSGDIVKLVVSSGSDRTNTIINEWSQWAETLPEGIDKSKYDIETKTMYSFRDKSTTTSLNSSMDGWIQYDKVTTNGEYGPWSEWSTSAPETKEGREINSKEQYASQNYETTTSDQSSLAGWNLVKSEFAGFTEFGEWSGWSTEGENVTDTGEVNYEKEEKTQYRFRDRSLETTWDANSAMDGWVATGRRRVNQNSWTGWSGNTTNPPYLSDSETYDVEVVKEASSYEKGKGIYHWYTWATKSGVGGIGPCSPQEWIGDKHYPYYHSFTTNYIITRRTKDNVTYAIMGNDDCGHGFDDYIAVWFSHEETETIYEPAIYKYRTASYEYEHQRWSDFGPWSDYTDEQLVGSDSRQVESRNVYRNRSRNLIYKYHFDRWTDWTGYGDTPITASDTVKVRTQKIYQYRDIQKITTYYFEKWGNWSDWRDEKIEKTSTRDVQTKTYYRYRKKSE